MSSPTLRRSEKLMSADSVERLIDTGFSGHLATTGKDGYPYCLPLLYVSMDGAIYVHGTAASGHLRSNVDHDDRVCFEIDEASGVFDYGRFECDSGLAYRSIVIFGRIVVVSDRGIKQRFCEMLMRKYGKPNSTRPLNYFPRLDGITVYRLKVERITGKEQVMPPISDQWPSVDRTKTPNA